MNEKELKAEYKRKHPRCEWCYWYKYNSPSAEHWVSCPDYTSCELKEKIILFPICAKFCKQYIIEEDIDEN